MDNRFICMDEVVQELSVSKPYAYKFIKKLNDEMKEQGVITTAGRVNRQHLRTRVVFICYIRPASSKQNNLSPIIGSTP